MYAAAVKPKKENKSRAAAYSVAQSKSGKKQGHGFVDNRPMAIDISRQRVKGNDNVAQTMQKKGEGKGSPENLKEGIENLSGYSMDDVNVHHNSPRPAQLQAHAYTQSTGIHNAPDQKKQLPHKTHQVSTKVTVQRKPSIAGNNSAGVLQLVRLDRSNVTQEVLNVYRSLHPMIQAYIYNTDSMDAFFQLSSDEQIKFLKVLQKSLPILDMIIQQQGAVKAITGPHDPQQQTPDLMQLRAMFFNLNPDFINQSLRLFLNQPAYLHFSNPQGIVTIEISSLAALRAPSPVKMLEGPEKPDILSINEVMAQDTLKGFMEAQHIFQLELEQMDGLDSAGLEFEFASFALPGQDYQKEEIIPSHWTMARTDIFGRRFGLAWKLESDSFNTLELVTPPFVYPRASQGQTKRKQIKQAVEDETHSIARDLEEEEGTLPKAAKKLAAAGLGTGWQVENPYLNFMVVRNRKSGGSVYSQENVSMFPEEIGAMLEDKFKGFNVSMMPFMEPVGLALQIRQALNDLLKGYSSNLDPEITDRTAVKNAIAVFARYASNAIAIPSMCHRQETGERKDTMPTEVKDTLDVWVKTDALNLLKPILAKPEDLQLFTGVLERGQEEVLACFTGVSEWMIQQATPPPIIQQKEPEIDPEQLRPLFLLLKQQNPQMSSTDLMRMAKEQLAPQAPQGPDPVEKMREYTALMIAEVEAFIIRAIRVAEHLEIAPTSTTEQFLQEEYGTGEGVRKGTYLKGIPTSKGSMYVTELRGRLL